jgi:putative transposase
MAASAVLDERCGSMKRSQFSEEQIVYALRWKKKYAHLGVSELRRLRQAEEENSRLKRWW